jgi:PAS domain S-box-containing protein
MKSDKSPSVEASELRRKAEACMRADLMTMQLPRNEAESRRLIHELQIYYVELEMQNVELRRARDEAERALEMYSDLYDFAPVGYLTLDREGLIRAANLTLAMLLGMERSRLIGRRFGSFLGADAAPDFIAFIDRIFASQTKETCEVALRSGEKFQKVVRIEAVPTVSGEECRAAVIDISVRRQLEKTLERLHTDLLAHAAELEVANIDLEAFNYTVSHDLRGPLHIISAYCDLVKEQYGSNFSEQCQGYIRRIQEGTTRMNKLIDVLLDFSRVKRVEMHLEKVDLTKLAEEVALGLRGVEPARPVTFRVAKGITADGDENLLRIVLDNMMGNAWKYSDKREETVIEFGMTEIDGKPAHFILDNGSGFDMEHAERLFRPFQRLAGTGVAGHGIGLATVDKIVRRHGGKVWAESKPGEGATFFFTLG